MIGSAPRYHGYRFPLGVSFRDVEDLLAQRGVTVSYEAIRLWCLTFGSAYARRLKRRQGRLGDTWHLDEVFVTIQGQRRYLWRAVDQDGDVLDILVQARRRRRSTACGPSTTRRCVPRCRRPDARPTQRCLNPGFSERIGEFETHSRKVSLTSRTLRGPHWAEAPHTTFGIHLLQLKPELGAFILQPGAASRESKNESYCHRSAPPRRPYAGPHRRQR